MPLDYPFGGKFKGDQWIPHTMGYQCGKCLHVMLYQEGTVSKLDNTYSFYSPNSKTSYWWLSPWKLQARKSRTKRGRHALLTRQSISEPSGQSNSISRVRSFAGSGHFQLSAICGCHAAHVIFKYLSCWHARLNSNLNERWVQRHMSL